MENKNIGATKITDKIRVSTAAIAYIGNWFGDYYQYETFIFSGDPNFKTRMFIWGTSGGDELSKKYCELSERAHRRISKIMMGKFNQFKP
jgi:hypothetical protein